MPRSTPRDAASVTPTPAIRHAVLSTADAIRPEGDALRLQRRRALCRWPLHWRTLSVLVPRRDSPPRALQRASRAPTRKDSRRESTAQGAEKSTSLSYFAGTPGRTTPLGACQSIFDDRRRLSNLLVVTPPITA